MKIPFQQYWDLLAKYIRPQRGRFILLAVLLLGSIGMQLVNPQIMRYFIDATQTSTQSRALVLAALAFIGVSLMQQVVGVSATYLGENVAWTATNALRAEMASHCLNLDMSYHNNVSPGELIERIDGDVAELSNFFSQLVIRVLGNILLLFGILISLLFVDWRVGLAFTGFAVLTLLALNAVRGIAIPYQKMMREATADLFGYLEERLAGTEDIRSSGAVDFVLLGIYKLSTRILKVWYAAQRRFVVVRFTAGMSTMLGVSMAFVAGYTLFHAGRISLGTVYLIVYYTNLLRRPIRELTQQVENLQNIGAATERLRDLPRHQKRDEGWFWGGYPWRGAGIILRECSFFLQGRRTRFRGDQLSARAGQGVGPVGTYWFWQDHPGPVGVPPVRSHAGPCGVGGSPTCKSSSESPARTGGSGYAGRAALPGQRPR